MFFLLHSDGIFIAYKYKLIVEGGKVKAGIYRSFNGL